MNADASHVFLLTHLGQSYDPEWSPDGKRIVFDTTRDGNSEIYVMNANGTNQTRLTRNPASDVKPSWSPDGKQIAFQTNRDGNDEIYVMSPVAGARAIDITVNPSRDADPAWSPNGRQIAFDTNRDGNDEIYVMNRNGTQQTRLTADPAEDLVPSW
jgi:Tol biopolymer transport system component